MAIPAFIRLILTITRVLLGLVALSWCLETAIEATIALANGQFGPAFLALCVCMVTTFAAGALLIPRTEMRLLAVARRAA
jgi:hypothetical protein